MLTNVTKHWQTTLTGAVLAVLQVIANGRSWQTIGIAVLTTLLGALSKDPNATH